MHQHTTHNYVPQWSILDDTFNPVTSGSFLFLNVTSFANVLYVNISFLYETGLIQRNN